ncbi:hypothetical protein RHMOL_Rhmol07G0239700 [Rhododendron molle]|uniref:Uncharacterized protein n=1 Tax=Rhododendron molle TaxID=49168 RepID=A0ACC0N429_RHOML|nr:hypothetical protein RHMOL_Rhmol07G0239700 [Rhododendron molle]
MGIKFEKVFFLVIVLVAAQLLVSLADESSFNGRITFSGSASMNEGLEQEGKAEWYLSHARKLREHFRFLKGGGGRGGGGGFSGVSSMKMSGSGGGGGGGGAGGKKSAALKAEVPTLFLPCMSLVVLTLIHLI